MHYLLSCNPAQLPPVCSTIAPAVWIRPACTSHCCTCNPDPLLSIRCAVNPAAELMSPQRARLSHLQPSRGPTYASSPSHLQCPSASNTPEQHPATSPRRLRGCRRPSSSVTSWDRATAWRRMPSQMPPPSRGGIPTSPGREDPVPAITPTGARPYHGGVLRAGR